MEHAAESDKGIGLGIAFGLLAVGGALAGCSLLESETQSADAVGTEPVAVRARDSPFEHERVGAVGRGRVRCGGPGRAATHDRDVYAFHTP